MNWVAISGSWRKTSDAVEADVRTHVRAVMMRGDGIVTGSALNEVCKFDQIYDTITLCSANILLKN